MNTLLALFIAFAYPLVPDSAFTNPHFCTKADKDFKEIRYSHVEVCSRNVSSSVKKRVYENYKVPLEERTNYTIDHLVPLSIGGSNNISNLWPQHKDISSVAIENEVYGQLSKGTISYQEAINKILNFKYKR